MERACVVPFKFATLFKSEDSLKSMLAERAGMLKETLRRLQGHEEWGVKIYCDMSRLRAWLAQNAEILKIDSEIGSAAPGRSFILRKKKEARLDTFTTAKLNECGQASFDRLKTLSARTRINKLLPEEVTERKEDMILNAAFLIDKNKVKTFIETVGQLKAQQESNGLSFDCTGPWPPFNFCDFSEGTN